MTTSDRTISSKIISTIILGLLAAASLVTGSPPDIDLDSFERLCKTRLDLPTIASFKQFANDLKSINEASLDAKTHEHLLKCVEQRDSIEALVRLIGSYDKVRPCKMSEVTKLANYAKQFLLNNKKAMVAKFFTLFGVNIGLKCKLNLLAHLKQADLEAEQLDFIYSMASPTGWNVLINEYTKKSMKFGTSGHADSHVINRVARLVPGLTLVDQLDYLDFDHVMNENKQDPWKGVERGSHKLKDASLRPKLLQSIEKIIESCNNLDKFYTNSVLSLAKLKELGLLVDYLNELHEKSVTLHKWLAATSFCQLMARVRLVEQEQQQQRLEGPLVEFEIIHDDKQLEGRRKLYTYVAKFDEIDVQARELVWHASVNEGDWRQKSEAMWTRGDSGSSKAIQQVTQFMKGVEVGFLEEKDNLQA